MESKIYKRDNNGSTRIWWAEIDGRRYRLCAGQLGGAITKSEWTTCTTKNAGRSNEVTPAEQARAEVKALYTKKLKRGYTKTLEEIDSAKKSLISPMLAHHWKDHKKKVKFPVYSQPKLDGIRCIARADGLWTRKGEKINTCPHIEELMVHIAKNRGISFDGELYNHEFAEDFNEIQSLITKKTVSPDRMKKVRRYVQYHIYDIIDEKAAFGERFKTLKDIVRGEISEDAQSIVLVHTIHCEDEDALDRVYDRYLERKYEGQMIRADTKYERKRTASLLKRKEFQDEEFEIIGMVEGKGNRSGMVGAIVFQTAGGKQFQAALMGTNDFRRRIWKEHKRNPFIGIDATVKYFHKTPDGIPRFPVVKSIDEGK